MQDHFKEIFIKYLRKILFLFICLSMFTGCLNAPPKVDEAASTNILPSSTVMLTLAPTFTLTPDLPTATPTLEPTFTPPSLPTLALRKNSSVYELVKPSPEGLLELMDILNTQYSYFSRQYDDKGNFRFNFILDELSSLFAVIDAETRFYYPYGFPDPEIVWNYYPFTSQDGYPVFPSVYLDSLTNAVLYELNRHPADFKAHGTVDGKGYTVKRYQLELDHDPQPEWLVRMDWEEIVALSWLVLDQNPDGNYTKLTQSLADMLWIIPTSTVTIETLQDFTGDGLTDIISLKKGYAAGSDWYSFYIAKGTRNGFQELDSIDHAVSVTNSAVEPHYTIETPSGSNLLTLTIVDPHRINWDCGWDTQTSYRWPNGIGQITITGKEIPQMPECSLARAVSLLDPVDNRTAIQLLENAIAHFDENDSEQRGKLLFAHYRLAILYALSDQDFRSRQHLEWLVENLTESEQYLKENLLLLLGEKKISAIKLCDSLYSAVAETPSSWEKYIGATAAAHAYPGSSEIYPPAICPLQDIIVDQLRKVDLTVQPIPEKALTDQMIPIALNQTYSFPDQAHSASFMLIREKTPYIAGYVPALDGWSWRILEEFEATEEPPQTFFKDVTGDGFPELAYFQKYKNWYCPENEQGYKVFLTTSAGTGFVSATNNICNSVDKTLDLAKHLPDENGDGVVDWVADQVRQYAGDSILTAEQVSLATWFTPYEIRSFIPEENNDGDNRANVISQLYESNNPSKVRQKLVDERNNLNPVDPFIDREWQRLTYLIAVSYEMEGQTDQAIETFTSVIQSNNQTLWGNLAELHLMPK
jgi:hypothetical protein